MIKRTRLNQFYTAKFAEGDVVDTEKFKETIRKAEGLRLEPYEDKGKDTVGYGHLLLDGRTGNISVDRIDKEDAEKLLEKDIKIRLKEVNSLLPNFVNFPKDAQQAIFSEYYRGSIGQSPVTRALINTGRYKEAAKEFLNNNEYKNADKNKMGGIKKRMEAVSKALIKMAKEKKESSEEKEITLPIKKPSKEEMDRLGFRYGGGADSGRSGGRGSRGPGRGSGGGRGQGGNKQGQSPGGPGKGRKTRDNSKQGQTPGGPGKGRETTKDKKERENREAENRREEARIASAAEAARVSQIKAREEKRRQDEEAANRREQARIATELENQRLREIKAKEEDRKERRDTGSTVSQVEATFGPTYSGDMYGYGIYADPTSSTYNKKYNEYYGSGFDSLNMSKNAEINYGDISQDRFTKEITVEEKSSLIDNLKNTYKDITTFGSENQYQLEPKKDGFDFTVSFKKGGLLDRSHKKK